MSSETTLEFLVLLNRTVYFTTYKGRVPGREASAARPTAGRLPHN